MAAVLIIGLMAATLLTFLNGSHVETTSGDPGLRDGVRVHVAVVKVLPEQDHMVVRLSFEPVGSFARGE